MTSLNYAGDRETKWMRDIARILALVWAGWWTFFGLASGLGEGLDPSGVAIHIAMPGLIFLIVALIAWRWEAIGGILLGLVGLIVLIAYPATTYGRLPPATISFAVLTMALPPLVAGMLFFEGWRRSKERVVA
jgi:hypothetical protein